VLPPSSGQKMKSEPVGVHSTYPDSHSVIRTTYSLIRLTRLPCRWGQQVPPKRCHLPTRTSLQTSSQQFGCGIARLTENTVTHTCYNSLMWYACRKMVPACTLLNICHTFSSVSSSSSSSSSSHVCHGVRPLVDPFRSHVSRSHFRGLPRFLLPVGE